MSAWALIGIGIAIGVVLAFAGRWLFFTVGGSMIEQDERERQQRRALVQERDSAAQPNLLARSRL
jgi:hypothetical protein